MQARGVSYTGYKREVNQDRYLVRNLPDGLLVAVADGMGGVKGGETAAQMVIEALDNARLEVYPNQEDLSDLLLRAHGRIQEQAELATDLEGMGTTATVAALHGGAVYWSHVGDSRLYLLRDGHLSRISTDHTFVQDLIDDGTLSLEEASRHPLRNMLDQCVGCSTPTPEKGIFPLLAGDKLLLCTDGLTRHVSEEHIKLSLAEDPQEAAEELAGKALSAGGKDNVTVLVLNAGDSWPSGEEA